MENIRKVLVEILKGGFAPNVILLKEFDPKKAGVILDGLHFSAWILLGHLHARHSDLLRFMEQPDEEIDLWPDALWPDNHHPSQQEWNDAVDNYAADLQKMIDLVSDCHTDIFKIQKNGKSLYWAAITVAHHTGYHIGQLKTIGRQLGVW